MVTIQGLSEMQKRRKIYLRPQETSSTLILSTNINIDIVSQKKRRRKADLERRAAMLAEVLNPNRAERVLKVLEAQLARRLEERLLFPRCGSGSAPPRYLFRTVPSMEH